MQGEVIHWPQHDPQADHAVTLPVTTILQPPGLLRRCFHRLIFPLRQQSAAAASSAASAHILSAFVSLGSLGGEIADQAQRVLAASMQIAQQCKAQSDRFKSSTTILDQICRIAHETGTISEQSRNNVATARVLLEDSAGIAVERTILTKDLIETLERSATGFRDLDSSVIEVERFLAIIQEIGHHTDLLALNAAIEAARAGQHGAGFNVVAREMRTLADNTQTAIKQIRAITGRMRSSSSSTAESIGIAAHSSERNLELGARAHSAIQSCIQSMQQAEASSGQLAAGSSNQIAAIKLLEDRWHTMRKDARESTFDADVSAERSMRTVELAVRLYHQLDLLADHIPPSHPAHAMRLLEERNLLKRQAEMLGAEAGLSRLERLRPSLEQALTQLQQECAHLGTPTRRKPLHADSHIPSLCFGGRSLNLVYDQVDTVHRATGFTTTLFVLASQDVGTPTFYRIATNVANRDGQRAVGTQLNPRGNVAQCLLKGESPYGYFYILGIPHIAIYAPIRDSSGEVLGAHYVGTPVNAPATELSSTQELAAPPQWW